MKTNLKTMLLALSITALLGTLSMNAGILHDAVNTGNVDKVKTVFEDHNNNIDIDEIDNCSLTALHRAVMNNNLEIVKCLVEHGADINKTNKWGTTSLHWAAQKRNLTMVKYLIERGADINKADKNHYAPLHMASNLEMVRYLVEHGADITLKNIHNETAFDLTYNQEIKEYLTHVENYFNSRTIVTLQSVNQNNQLINPLAIPDYGPLAMRINHLCDINTFAQISQICHYVNTIRFNVKSDDGLVTALWLHYKQNPKAEIIKTKTGLKFLTQKNLLTKIEGTKTPFADIIVMIQK